jgi:hypothetical protein
MTAPLAEMTFDDWGERPAVKAAMEMAIGCERQTAGY